jgi:CO/xanthine dehydrogenase FAD-binding subunit
LAYLVTHRDEAQLLAGGTDLMPRLQRGENTPRRLGMFRVSVTFVASIGKVTMSS